MTSSALSTTRPRAMSASGSSAKCSRRCASGRRKRPTATGSTTCSRRNRSRTTTTTSSARAAPPAAAVPWAGTPGAAGMGWTADTVSPLGRYGRRSRRGISSRGRRRARRRRMCRPTAARRRATTAVARPAGHLSHTTAGRDHPGTRGAMGNLPPLRLVLHPKRGMARSIIARGRQGRIRSNSTGKGMGRVSMAAAITKGATVRRGSHNTHRTEGSRLHGEDISGIEVTPEGRDEEPRPAFFCKHHTVIPSSLSQTGSSRRTPVNVDSDFVDSWEPSITKSSPRGSKRESI